MIHYHRIPSPVERAIDALVICIDAMSPPNNDEEREAIKAAQAALKELQV